MVSFEKALIFLTSRRSLDSKDFIHSIFRAQA